jgi:addiction module HigA family antidote
MSKRIFPPVHPGEMLREEFLPGAGITLYRLGKATGIPTQRLYEIVAEKRAITAKTDLRLCRFFGLSEGFWLRLQNRYDLELEKMTAGEEIEAIVPLVWPDVDAREAVSRHAAA